MTGPNYLNVASPDCAEDFFRGHVPRCVAIHHANSLAALREVLELQLDQVTSATVLDLIGHSTREHHLLRLGTTPIDMLHPGTAGFFRALHESRLLPRLQITTLRLLGCETAVTEAGRRTLRMLAQTLRLPVYGTTVPLLKSHSNAQGFDPTFSHLLVEASTLT
jgi:hypothetical protein